MLIEVTHTTEFQYDDEVMESTMEARLHPCTDGDQRCLSFELSVQPATRVFSYRDGFANTVHCFTILPAHTALTLTAHSRVETLVVNPFALPGRPPAVPDAVDTWLYRQYHGPVLPDREVEALADRFRPAEPAGLLEALQQVMGHIHDTFEYQPEVTTVHSSVKDVLSLRRGVCQDFSHLMIAVCRAMDVPARYVSGYILSSSERLARGGGASHAWCEAYVPGYGWLGFDPTNNVLAADGHVKVGAGRDYTDVPPTCGIHRGLAAERIAIAVRTVRLDTPEA